MEEVIKEVLKTINHMEKEYLYLVIMLNG